MQSERRCISALNFAVCIHWEYSQWIKFPALNVSHSGSSTPFLGFIWALSWNKIWNLLSPPSPKQWGNPPSVVSKLSVDARASLYKLDLRTFATPLKDKDPDVCSAGFTRRNHGDSQFCCPMGFGFGGRLEDWGLGTCWELCADTFMGEGVRELVSGHQEGPSNSLCHIPAHLPLAPLGTSGCAGLSPRRG